MLFRNSGTDIGRAFGVELITSSVMQAALERWDDISTGRPPWLNGEDGIETINMAKHISDTRAKLTALDIGIALSGSARAEFLQGIADSLLERLPDKLCEADRLGGMIVKWNGGTWDFILPGDFGVTALDDNGSIVGVIFASHIVERGRSFTRLEHHSLEKGGLYRVRNKAFLDRAGPGGSVMLGQEIPLAQVYCWGHLAPEVTIKNIMRPLFAHYRVPGANTIDPGSPLGLSVFANAVTELKAIDIAVSRKNTEVEDSKHITFVGQNLVQFAGNRQIQLPRFVKGLGIGLKDNETTSIHEHTPTLLTDQRIKDINFDLSMAGVKCGFSEGVFVMDGQTGMITATQVEADDRDTIQTIKADRDALRAALEQALYGADVLCTLYSMAPAGSYETAFNFGDITYSYEEDKAAWRSYVAQGWVPRWLYFVKFEGMSEEEAKTLCAEAEASQREKAGLFGAE